MQISTSKTISFLIINFKIKKFEKKKNIEKMSENESSMLNSSNTSSASDVDGLEKQFNCIKCCVKLKDVKLLKTHFWQVHISNNEINKAKLFVPGQSIENLTPTVTKSGTKKRKINEGSSKKGAKKRLSLFDSKDKENQSEHEDQEEEEDEDEENKNVKKSSKAKKQSDEQKLISKLENLTDDEIKMFNLTKDIDEYQLHDKFKLLEKEKPYNKSRFYYF